MTGSGWQLVRQEWGAVGVLRGLHLPGQRSKGWLLFLTNGGCAFREEEVWLSQACLFQGVLGLASLKPTLLPSCWAVYSSLGLKSVYFKRRERLGFTTGSIGSSSTMDGTEGFLSWSRQPSHTQSGLKWSEWEEIMQRRVMNVLCLYTLSFLCVASPWSLQDVSAPTRAHSIESTKSF